MNLLELFRRLALGELSNLSMADKANQTIKDADRPQVILHANEALLRLHTRFILREESLILQSLAHRSKYPLLQAHSFSVQSQPNALEPFIIDNEVVPFGGKVVRVLDVADSTGKEYNLNVQGDPNSLFTPKGDVLEIPYPLCGRAFAITYQASHADLDPTDPIDEEQAITIPELLETALTSYIAHKVYAHKNTQESMMAGREYLSAYEAICLDAEQRDLLSTARSRVPNKFNENGWV